MKKVKVTLLDECFSTVTEWKKCLELSRSLLQPLEIPSKTEVFIERNHWNFLFQSKEEDMSQPYNRVYTPPETPNPPGYFTQFRRAPTGTEGNYSSLNVRQSNPSSGGSFAGPPTYYIDWNLGNVRADQNFSYNYIKDDFGQLCHNLGEAIETGNKAAVTWRWNPAWWLLGQRNRPEWNICKQMCQTSDWHEEFTEDSMRNFILPDSDKDKLVVACSTPDPGVCGNIGGVIPRYAYFYQDAFGQPWFMVKCMWDWQDFTTVEQVQAFYNDRVTGANISDQDLYLWREKIMPAFCSGESTDCLDVTIPGETKETKPAVCSKFRDAGTVGDLCRSWANEGRDDYEDTVDGIYEAYCRTHNTLYECSCLAPSTSVPLKESYNFFKEHFRPDGPSANLKCWYSPCSVTNEYPLVTYDIDNQDCRVYTCQQIFNFDRNDTSQITVNNNNQIRCSGDAFPGGPVIDPSCTGKDCLIPSEETPIQPVQPRTGEGFPGWAIGVVIAVVVILVGVIVGVIIYKVRHRGGFGGTFSRSSIPAPAPLLSSNPRLFQSVNL